MDTEETTTELEDHYGLEEVKAELEELYELMWDIHVGDTEDPNAGLEAIAIVRFILKNI